MSIGADAVFVPGDTATLVRARSRDALSRCRARQRPAQTPRRRTSSTARSRPGSRATTSCPAPDHLRSAPGRLDWPSQPRRPVAPCTTSANGSVPPQRHTQHRRPDGGLYAEELFGVEGFTGRSSLLYHLVPPTQTHKIEPVREVRLEAADEKAPSSSPDQDRRRPAQGRCDLGPDSSLLQQRRRLRGRPAGRSDARGPVLPERRRRRDALRPRGHGRLRHDLRAPPLRPRRLPRPPHRHDLAPGSGRRLRAADAVPGGALRDRAAQALSERLRPAAGAFAVRPARPPCARGRRPRRRRAATS